MQIQLAFLSKSQIEGALHPQLQGERDSVRAGVLDGMSSKGGLSTLVASNGADTGRLVSAAVIS